MNIIIKLSAHYIWKPAPKGWVPAPEDLERRAAKQAADDSWLQRVVQDRAATHTVAIPEGQITDRLAALERQGTPTTRAKFAVEYLEKVVMPHQHHVDHIELITVHDEPAVEAFLNLAFETGKSKAVTP